MKFYGNALKTNVPPVESNVYGQLRERVAVSLYESESGKTFQGFPVEARERYMQLADAALSGVRKHQDYRYHYTEDPKKFPTFKNRVVQPVLYGAFMFAMVLLFPILYPIQRRNQKYTAKTYREQS